MALGFVQQSVLESNFPRISLSTSSSSSSSTSSSRLFAGDDDSSQTWMESLKARQVELTKEQFFKEQKWRHADCSSGIRLALPDWVRRLDVEYPLLACGSAKGNIYVSNLETGKLVATNARSEDDEDDDDYQYRNAGYGNTPYGLDKALGLLYGKYDGGGTLAVAFADNLICEAPRKGSVDIWRVDASSKRLVSQGTMQALDGYVVTCLELDEDYLWVGTANGHLHAYPLDASLPLALQKEPELEWKFSTAVLSFALDSEIGCGVVTTANGGVEVISLEDDTRPICSFYPPMDPRPLDMRGREDENAYALCSAIVSHPTKGSDEENDTMSSAPNKYSVICGGSDGSLWMHELNLTEDGELNEEDPLAGNLRQLRPSHMGPIKCLANPLPGLLVSAGLDGSMRVWDIEDGDSLYQFVGYKVWLGSLWTDGSRLVSDGSDNSVIMHDFDKPYSEDDGEL